ncbi:MAG: MOSC domain-containing protein [Gammaproteobacteria bacterium]|nr:MOSC domain-containing protein [Gammaproteobacteria bacterium]MCB1882222.1 MOSC domain-containing protein [Gammaproteobacteria bacterium]
MSTQIRAVLIAKCSLLGSRGVASGIFKRPLDNSVEVTRTGLAGDEHGDKKHHGGPEKAIHHYPFDHYAIWKSEVPKFAVVLDREGAFGENISTEGLTEADVCIGDIYRLGTALVEVSQARQPCWRLNERFGNTTMARRVQDTGRTGWYYRVLDAGQVGPGDSIDLVERPAPDWPLSRILHLLYRDTLNIDDLAQLTELNQLPESWRLLARRRLENRTVEEWSRRLNTPEGAKP